MGGRLSDHGLTHCYADFPTEADAAAIFDRARAGQAAGAGRPRQVRLLPDAVLRAARRPARLDQAAPPGRAAQHQHARLADARPGHRLRLHRRLAAGRSRWRAYLDRLEQEDALPKMILYNNNPTDNYALATMIGNFQDGTMPGKMQFGSGWWFLDTKEGMEWQLNALSNVGLLSRFVGMLTDSRSFMSYPRHEYFRRVLCNLLGRDIENGEIPDDDELVGPMIENICFGNARQYLGLDIPEVARSMSMRPVSILTSETAVVLGGTGVLGGGDGRGAGGGRGARRRPRAQRGARRGARPRASRRPAARRCSRPPTPWTATRWPAARDAIAGAVGAGQRPGQRGRRQPARRDAAARRGLLQAAAGGLAGRLRPEPGRRRRCCRARSSARRCWRPAGAASSTSPRCPA